MHYSHSLFRVRPLTALLLLAGISLSGISMSGAMTETSAALKVAALETDDVVPQDLETIEDDPLTLTENLKTKKITILSGDTLMRAITRAGANRVQAYNAIEAISEHFNPRKLKPGHILTLFFDKPRSEAGDIKDVVDRLVMVRFRPDPLNELVVVRNDIGEYVSTMAPIELTTKTERTRGIIQSSLNAAAKKAKMPQDITFKFINIYSYGVDFQREVQPGDSFEVMYEVRYDDTGSVIDYGDILYAELTLSGGTRALYRFEDAGLSAGYGYFDAEGHSAIRALMRTPINGARLSSGFGNRKHPILGYKKHHKGLDFAAPKGTPILAAGDGVIDKIGRNGAYGHYIRIRHNNNFQTAYAHLSRYAKGMTRNTRVHQGQVIGYVGSTGRSTGPHLHYEIIRNGRQVNPRTVELPTTENLDGGLLDKLQNSIETTQKVMAATPLTSVVAAR